MHKGKLRALADKGSRPASRALALAEDGEHVAVALLLATTLAQIGMAALLLDALQLLTQGEFLARVKLEA